ncbi:MAG: hypothetical protein NW201_13540 [Gemmatimonadales bacterium]|nr:hypothetical protein [Gemmatimonadales bacterium]
MTARVLVLALLASASPLVRPPVLAAQASAPALQGALRGLLGAHTAALASATGLLLAGDDAGFRRAADSVDANARALAGAIGGIYGAAGGEQFLELWRAHIGFLLDYAQAYRRRDRRAYERGVVQLVGYAGDLADFLRAANPTVDRTALAELVSTHILGLMRVVDAQAGRQPAPVTAERIAAASAHMPMIADAIAAAIARQFPEKFPAK